MEILCYALSAAVLVLTGAVISGGVVLPRRLPKEHTAESTPEDTLSRDLAALMNYGREEDNDEICPSPTAIWKKYERDRDIQALNRFIRPCSAHEAFTSAGQWGGTAACSPSTR